MLELKKRKYSLKPLSHIENGFSLLKNNFIDECIHTLLLVGAQFVLLRCK